jgi:hypothetical protein
MRGADTNFTKGHELKPTTTSGKEVAADVRRL